MKRRSRGRVWLSGTTLLATGVIGLTGCGGAESPAAAAGECGTLKLAQTSWSALEANNAVIAYLAEKELGCHVEYVKITEDGLWEALAVGDVDVVLGNWSDDSYRQRFVEQQGRVVELGPDGTTARAGWYVPAWMVKKYPEITNWQELSKKADLFRVGGSSSPAKLLGPSSSDFSADRQLVDNLDPGFTLQYTQGETDLIQAFKNAEKSRAPMLGYFRSPSWYLAENTMVRVKLPAHTEGCDDVLGQTACDYPSQKLEKLASKVFVDSDGPALALIKSFSWTNEQQTEVAAAMLSSGSTPEKAAQAWVQKNSAAVKNWLK
ncbi:MAG: glycine betaine/proline transport system substrate-binding protein [Actinomycetota bacterium]|nr:glycine betaine/proline transport system substrate-binding protein [Actinomycetota bacterium]